MELQVWVMSELAGPCRFQEESSRKLAATSESKTVSSLQDCRALCLTATSASQPEQQCAAAHYRASDGTCSLQMSIALHVTDAFQAYSLPSTSDHTLLIKRCYNCEFGGVSDEIVPEGKSRNLCSEMNGHESPH